MDKIALVAHWVQERNFIRMQRDTRHPPPWTTDPILAEYRFCNVCREDDRVTRWIAKHWRTPYADHPNLPLAMAMARFFNWPPTLAEIGFPIVFEPSEMLFRLRRIAKRGDRVWNSAYMISTCGQQREKAAHVVDVFSRMQASKFGVAKHDGLEDAWSRLVKVDGIGKFIAAQIVADLKYAPGYPLQNAKDWWTWAAPGPGSERGLRWYLGREKPIAAFEFLPRLTDMAQAVTPLIGDIAPLHMQDWQNVACEIGKYVKALNGGRKPRRLYRSTETDYAL